MIRDMVQFGAIFAVFLFSFSGAFYLALRGEVHLPAQSDCLSCNITAAENDTGQSQLNTSLNLYPFETSYVDDSLTYQTVDSLLSGNLYTCTTVRYTMCGSLV